MWCRYNRYLVHWEVRERMTETDVETILLRGGEVIPEATPRITPRTRVRNSRPEISKSSSGPVP